MIIYHSNTLSMSTVTVDHSLTASSHGCNMTYVILRYICLLLNNLLMQLGNGLWHCASPSYAVIQFNPFTSGFGGTSITLMLFAFRRTVVTLVVWAGAPSYSNCNPLLFLNMSYITVWSTSCWYRTAVRLPLMNTVLVLWFKDPASIQLLTHPVPISPNANCAN